MMLLPVYGQLFEVMSALQTSITGGSADQQDAVAVYAV